MRITKIATDEQGYKLIAAHDLLARKQAKPIKVNTFLFDYKDGILRFFNQRSTYRVIPCTTFKDAVKYIFSL